MWHDFLLGCLFIYIASCFTDERIPGEVRRKLPPTPAQRRRRIANICVNCLYVALFVIAIIHPGTRHQ